MRRLLSAILFTLLLVGMPVYSASPASYEYWIDHDISDKKTGSVTGSTLSQTIPVSGLSPGFHWINYRLTDAAGRSGGVYRNSFYILPSDTNAVAWQYWFDDDKTSIKSGEVTSGTQALDIDLTGFAPGLHFFNYRLTDAAGRSGGVYRNSFYILPSGTNAVAWQYWFDNDKTSIKSGEVTSGTQALDIDLAGFAPGFHFFNFRYMSSNGECGGVYRKHFVIIDTDGKSAIGYRHSINGIDLGYVEQEIPAGNTFAYTVEIPAEVIMQMESSPLMFSGDDVTSERSGNVNYSVQLKSKTGLGLPSEWDIDVTHTFTTTAIPMDADTSRTFDIPQAYEFVAVRFSSDGKPLFFRSDTPVALDIYRNGSKIKEIPASMMTSMTEVDVAEGEYFAIFHDAEDNGSGVFTLQFVKALAATIDYDGRYLRFSTLLEDARILYSFDGIPQYTEEMDYDGNPIDVCSLPIDSSFTVSTVISKEGADNSVKSSYTVEYCGGDEKAWTSKSGQLASCYEWNEGSVVSDNLVVSGCIGEKDYEWLRNIGGIRFLDISGVTDSSLSETGNVLENGYLGMPELVVVSVPENILRCGDRVFDNASKLCAVILPERNETPENLLSNVPNPNLIVYNNSQQSFSEDLKARFIEVKGGMAKNVRLHEGYPFYCPEEFRASEISYERNFSKLTGINGDCAGWETIALPFDVESVTHAKGTLLPFAVNSEETDLRYWLYSPDPYAWQRAEAIKGYEPYLIAMPNNPAYYEPYNLAGPVTFSAQNVIVRKTPGELDRTFFGDRLIAASFLGEDKTAGILAVNDEPYEAAGTVYVPGSQFVGNVRNVRPFEAYVVAEPTLAHMPIFDTSDVESIMGDMEMHIWQEGNSVCILSGFSTKVSVYDTLGHIVRTADVIAGETCRISGMTPGIYIVAGRKITVR